MIDTGVPYGDAGVAIEGFDNPVGPLSTIAGAFALNAVVVRAVELRVGAGQPPDTFVSANVEGAQRIDLARWRQRVKQL